MSEFCFRRKREARRAREMENTDMYHPAHGGHVPKAQGRAARSGRQGPRPRQEMRAPRRETRPRGPAPQFVRPRQERAPRRDARAVEPQAPRRKPRRERARRGPAFAGNGPRSGGFVERLVPPQVEFRGERFFPSGPRFPVRGDRYPPRQDGFYTDRSFEQPAQHWFPSYLTNPSVGPYVHPMSFY